MKNRTKGQQLRLLIDKLEGAAVEAGSVVVDLPEVKGKAGDLVPKTPDGIRSLIAVLKMSFKTVQEEENAPTNEELLLLQDLEPAKKALDEARELVKQAQVAFNKALEGHVHRIRLEDPKINGTNGAVLYPDHPTCVVCGEELEYEWYCERSPELRCLYPNVINKGGGRFVYGTDLMEADHDGDIECVHCGNTWTRMK